MAFSNEDYMYKFKPAVLENVTFDFSPVQNPSFFKGTAAPTGVIIRANFLEIEYWLQEDVVDSGLRSQGLGAFGFVAGENSPNNK
jgi:hypothetical protein